MRHSKTGETWGAIANMLPTNMLPSYGYGTVIRY
ncbi:hypothetical protein L195_g032013, partial [Trifolium pratense]